MHVAHLTLADYRNYERADIALEPGAVLFIGRNGQGKTNLVEAIAYAGTASSHRVSTDQALIRFGAESAIIRARIQHADRAIVVEIELNRASPNRAQVNHSPVRVRDLPRYFSSVVFAPEDLALVRSDPAVRRGFLDTLVVQKTPRFAGVMSDYDRVVRQRNSLLKSARASRLAADSLTTLDVWDDRLVSLGTEIIMARAAIVQALQPHVAQAYSAVAGDDHHTRLSMRLSVDGRAHDDAVSEPGGQLDDTAEQIAERFHRVLIENRRTELDRAVTMIGPHRDDLMLELNQLPARGYASHGESWSFALALKLASAEVLRENAVAGDPVLILDDVFAELDEGRRERLADAVGGFEQVLITAAVGADVPERLAARRVSVVAGTIAQASL